MLSNLWMVRLWEAQWRAAAASIHWRVIGDKLWGSHVAENFKIIAKKLQSNKTGIREDNLAKNCLCN